MKTTYSIQPINSDAHKDGLIRLWKTYLQKYFDDRFEWLYTENPSGSTKTVLATQQDDDEVVGCASITPRPFFIDGSKFSAGITMDFIVHENHRTYGPALKLQRANFSTENVADFDMILAFPNKAAKGPMLRVGCKELGASSLFTKVLKTKSKLGRFIKLPVAAKAVGSVLDRILSAADFVRAFPGPGNRVASIATAFDHRFDAFWGNVKSDVLIADRSAAYLNWRYAGNRNPGYQIFCLTDKNSESLKGYVVYFIKDRVANVEDMFALNDKSEWQQLLFAFSRHMRKQDVDAVCVAYFGDEMLVEVFRKLNFFKNKEARSVLLHISPDLADSEKKTALNPGNWCLFEGDLDL